MMAISVQNLMLKVNYFLKKRAITTGRPMSLTFSWLSYKSGILTLIATIHTYRVE